MAKKLRPIKKPNTKSKSPAYWNKVLTSWGLSEEKGRPARIWENRGTDNESLGRVISFIGSTVDVQKQQEERHRKLTGKVSPSGHGPA